MKHKTETFQTQAKESDSEVVNRECDYQHPTSIHPSTTMLVSNISCHNGLSIYPKQDSKDSEYQPPKKKKERERETKTAILQQYNLLDKDNGRKFIS